MRNATKKLVYFYLFLVIAKIILSLFVTAPSVFSDEYVYAKLARGIFFSGELKIHQGIFTTQQMPFYPLVISIAYILKDVDLVYLVIKGLNALLLTLSIFPVFYLAKDFVDEKKAFFVAAIVSFIPSLFITSFYIMSENAFYPLFLFWIFFTYKALKEESSSYFILAGGALGLCFLSRFIALGLIPVLFLVSILKVKKVGLKNIVYYYTPPLGMIALWFLRNLNLTKEASQVTGVYSAVGEKLINSVTVLILPFANWILLYLGYLLFSSGIIFGIYALLCYKIKDKNLKILFSLFLLSSLIFVLAAANESSSFRIFFESPFLFFTRRPLGRYVECVTPLLVLLGFIGFEKIKINNPNWKKLLLYSSCLLLLTSQLTIAPLFPFNNSNVTALGVGKYILDITFVGKFVDTQIVYPSFFILALVLVVLPWFFLKKKSWQPKLIMIFFIVSSIAAFGVTYKESEKWSQSPQMKFGHEIEKEYPSSKIILFDERDCVEQLSLTQEGEICEKSKKSTLMGFWLNKDIIIGNVETQKADLVISKHQLNLKKVKDLNGGVFVYQP